MTGSLLSLTAALFSCSLVFITLPGSEYTVLFYPLIFTVTTPLILFINRTFLKRSRTLLGLVLLNIPLVLSVPALMLLFEEYREPAVLIIALGFNIFLTVFDLKLIYRKPVLGTALALFDLSVATLAVSSAVFAVCDTGFSYCIPAASACVLSLMIISIMRAGKPLSAGEWIIKLSVFAVILLAMLFLVSTVAEPAGAGIVMLWNAFLATVRYILTLIWRFLCFLASFLPESGPYELMPYEYVPEETGEELPQTSPFVEMLMNLISVCLILALLIITVKKLASIRLGGKKVAAKKQERITRKRISLFSGLKKAFLILIKAIKRKLMLFRIRNTAPGVYFALISECRFTPQRKRQSETASEFLDKLANVYRDAHGSEENTAYVTSALNELSAACSRYFYSGKKQEESFSQASLLRKAFRSPLLYIKAGFTEFFR